jgi:hypothetical protein
MTLERVRRIELARRELGREAERAGSLECPQDNPERRRSA